MIDHTGLATIRHEATGWPFGPKKITKITLCSRAMAETATASSQPSADKAGGVIPELDELKLCIRTIKDENPEQGIAKAKTHELKWSVAIVTKEDLDPKLNNCLLALVSFFILFVVYYQSSKTRVAFSLS